MHGFSVTDTMNSLTGIDLHIHPESSVALCGLDVTDRPDNDRGIDESLHNDNNIATSCANNSGIDYESATSDILDIFSTGEVTKAQNGETTTTTSDELCRLFDPFINCDPIANDFTQRDNNESATAQVEPKSHLDHEYDSVASPINSIIDVCSEDDSEIMEEQLNPRELRLFDDIFHSPNAQNSNEAPANTVGKPSVLLADFNSFECGSPTDNPGEGLESHFGDGTASGFNLHSLCNNDPRDTIGLSANNSLFESNADTLFKATEPQESLAAYKNADWVSDRGSILNTEKARDLVSQNMSQHMVGTVNENFERKAVEFDSTSSDLENFSLGNMPTINSAFTHSDDIVTSKSNDMDSSIPTLAEILFSNDQIPESQDPTETYGTCDKSENGKGLQEANIDRLLLEPLSQPGTLLANFDDTATVLKPIDKVDTGCNVGLSMTHFGLGMAGHARKSEVLKQDIIGGSQTVSFNMPETGDVGPSASGHSNLTSRASSNDLQEEQICSDEEDIYQEQSIYDLYKSDSEEDIPESMRFNQSHENEDLAEADNPGTSTERTSEIISTDSVSLVDENMLYLCDIARLFDEKYSAQPGRETAYLVENNVNSETETEQNQSEISKDENDSADFQTEGGVLKQPCPPAQTTATPTEAIVHNPSVKKLRRNSSKIDVLSKCKQNETEPSAPPAFSEQFSKRIHEKLTKEGLYDISKPLSEGEKQNLEVCKSPSDPIIDAAEGNHIYKHPEERILGFSCAVNEPSSVKQDYPNTSRPSKETPTAPFAKADASSDTNVPQRFYDTTTFCFQRNRDERHGVYSSKTFYEKRRFYDNKDEQHRKPESPFPGEQSIYDAYPSYDTDDDSREKRVSLTYTKKKIKNNTRMRIIEKICKITSGISPESASRKPIKIFRGNPIC